MTEDDEYVIVKISVVGSLDPVGMQGALRMESIGNPNMIMEMTAFSGEVAAHISRFMNGDRKSLPTVYNMLEEMAEYSGLHLERVKIYPSGDRSALRASLSFTGKAKNILLDGYRASDAVALAALYDCPILVHTSLLKDANGKEKPLR